MVLRNSYEMARQNFCDQCNEKFGLNVTTTFNDSSIGDGGLFDSLTGIAISPKVDEVENVGLDKQESEVENNGDSDD